MAESDQANDESEMRVWHRIQATSGRVPPACSCSASCVVEGELYVFGGLGLQAVWEAFWKYSFKRDSWEEVQVLSDVKPGARFRTCFAACQRAL